MGGFKSLKESWRRLGKVEKTFVSVYVGLMVLYAGAKHGTIGISDNYIRDNGSYLDGDVCHISIEKKISALPDDTSILVYARPYSSTNVADWVRLEPYLLYRDHPYSYHLANATNYNVIVAADYKNPPSVHTNGVLIFKGFLIPGTNKATFPNTRIKEIEP